MLKAQVEAVADSESRTLLKTVASMGPGAAHPFHEYRSGSRLPRRQACCPHDAGHALTLLFNPCAPAGKALPVLRGVSA